jgi:hypothetical protein
MCHYLSATGNKCGQCPQSLQEQALRLRITDRNISIRHIVFFLPLLNYRLANIHTFFADMCQLATGFNDKRLAVPVQPFFAEVAGYHFSHTDMPMMQRAINTSGYINGLRQIIFCTSLAPAVRLRAGGHAA